MTIYNLTNKGYHILVITLSDAADVHCRISYIAVVKLKEFSLEFKKLENNKFKEVRRKSSFTVTELSSEFSSKDNQCYRRCGRFLRFIPKTYFLQCTLTMFLTCSYKFVMFSPVALFFTLEIYTAII